MNKNPKDTLLETLTIIGYTDDRDKFAEEFLNLCQQQAFLNLIQKLPKEKGITKKSISEMVPGMKILWKVFSKGLFRRDDQNYEAFFNNNFLFGLFLQFLFSR